MKPAFLLVILILWTQNADAKEIRPINTDVENLIKNHIYLFRSTELANVDVNRLLSISDLWDKIKNSISNAWNAIKEIANKTKEKINKWMLDLKKRADEALKDFQARLEVLKVKFNKLIEDIKKTAGDVKLCIHEDKAAIEKLLKEIALRVTACIAESIKKPSSLKNQSRFELNDSEFLNKADEKINNCVQNAEKVEDCESCLNKARGELFDDMERTETAIMESRTETRDMADSALETILQCTADGLIEASEAITEEVTKIINCVINEKENGLYV